MKRNESKYKQVVNHVIDGINNGSYKKGDWILSINEFRKNYNLSRDTVFAGLSELKSKGIIDSTPGVGYYIATTRIAQKLNIFLLFKSHVSAMLLNGVICPMVMISADYWLILFCFKSY